MAKNDAAPPEAAGGTAGPLHTRRRLPGSRDFWIAWVALAAVTLALSIEARLTTYSPGDLRAARAVQSIDIPGIGGLLNFENTIGGPTPAVIIIVLITLALLLIRRGRFALMFVLINALRGVGSVVKTVVDRPRPDASLLHVTTHASGASFPSGHVFSAVLLYGTLAVLAEVLPLPRIVRRVVQALCLAVILLMGPARVYAGVHWPSDVLGGYLWGSALLLLALDLSYGSHLLPRPAVEQANQPRAGSTPDREP